MCGIFGFTSSNNNPKEEIKILKRLFLLSESRGKEACGLAIDNSEQISYTKTPIPASDFIRKKAFEPVILQKLNSDFKSVIGHSRLVTNGYEQDKDNNQPVVKNGIVTVHNGIIVNQEALWKTIGVAGKQSDLDTELIPTIVGQHLTAGKSIVDAVRSLYQTIEGIANIAMMLDHTQGLILATNNGSLYYLYHKANKMFLFSSEKHTLQVICEAFDSFGFNPKDIRHLSPGHILMVDDSFTEKIVAFDDSTSIALPKISPKTIIEIPEFDFKTTFQNTSMEYNFETIPEDFQRFFAQRHEVIAKLKRCSKCILPESFPGISFDDKGVCSYCSQHKPKVLKSTEELITTLEKYKTDSKQGHDCILPFSGGRDSSYVMHYVTKELGMKPIAFSYDWGMLTDLGRRNQSRMCAKLGVEHILVSADIRQKRHNIKLNVEAWLHRPHLGTIPLFMAGDKHYFYYNNLIMKQNDLKISIMGENHLEKTGFKTAFSGAKQDANGAMAYHLSTFNKLKMLGFYASQYLTNPKYINSSLWDTAKAFLAYYGQKHDYLNLFDYIDWDEKTVDDTLINQYGWELDRYTKSTWRIGDGTAAFYNYIYYTVAGFSENDTFRSNQIREGKLTREEALQKTQAENQPRWESIQWYCNTIRIDWKEAIKIINRIKPLYG